MRTRTAGTYNVHEAKTHLSRLLERASMGEEVVIARAGVPVARLVPIVSRTEVRPLGTEKGRLVVPDDFDAPLPDEIIELFET